MSLTSLNSIFVEILTKHQQTFVNSLPKNDV